MRLSLLLQRVSRGRIGKLGVVGLTELSVLIKGHLPIQGDDLTRLRQYQRVDLNQGGVLGGEDFIELHEHWRDQVDEFLGEVCGLRNLLGLVQGNPGRWVDCNAREGIGTLFCELLDFHTALVAAQHQVVTVGAIKQHGEVELLVDIRTSSNHHPANNMALDVEAENCLCGSERISGGRCDLNTASLPAATGFDLRLDDGQPANLLRGSLCLLWSVSSNACQDGNTVALKHVSGLIFVKVHASRVLPGIRLGMRFHCDCLGANTRR